MKKPPYPDNICLACERGEKVIIASYSSVLGIAAMHTPSTHVCMKYIHPDIIKKLEEVQRDKYNRID